MSPRGREVRVGLVILVAMVVLAAGVFLIGSKNNLFKHKIRYYTDCISVSGLKRGSPVQIDGVDVGTIEKVVLSEDPKKTQIRVWIHLDEDYAARIRGPAAPNGLIKNQVASQARIKTLGLLGDKFIDINSGSPVYPPIPEEGEVPAAQPTNVDALIASGEDVMDNVVEISHSLNRILQRMERGEGLLGQLTSDTPEGRRMQSALVNASESLERIAGTVEHGKGPLPRLLNDRAMADQLAVSLDRFQTLLDQAQHGPGLLPGLLNDPAPRAQFNETLASLQRWREPAGFYGRSAVERRRPAPASGEGQGVRPRGDRAAPAIREKPERGLGQARPGGRHGGEADQRPEDLRRRQRHRRRRQPVPGAALADPQPAEEGDREALRRHEADDREIGREAGALDTLPEKPEEAKPPAAPADSAAPPPPPAKESQLKSCHPMSW